MSFLFGTVGVLLALYGLNVRISDNQADGGISSFFVGYPCMAIGAGIVWYAMFGYTHEQQNMLKNIEDVMAQNEELKNKLNLLLKAKN